MKKKTQWDSVIVWICFSAGSAFGFLQSYLTHPEPNLMALVIKIVSSIFTTLIVGLQLEMRFLDMKPIADGLDAESRKAGRRRNVINRIIIALTCSTGISATIGNVG